MSNDDQVPPPLVGPRIYRPGQSSQKQPQSQQSSQKQPPSGYVPPPDVGPRTTKVDPITNTVLNVKPQISSLGGSSNPTVSSTAVPVPPITSTVSSTAGSGPPITPTVSSTAVPGSSVSTPSTVVSTSIDFKNEDVIAGVMNEWFNINDTGFRKTNYDDLKTDIENATMGKNFKHLIERFFYNKAELGLTEIDLKKYNKLYFGGTPEQDIRTQMKDADKIKLTNIDWYFTVYIGPRTTAVIGEVETTMAAKNLKDTDTLLLNKYGFTIGLEHNVNHGLFDELERNIMGSKLSDLKHLIFKTYTNEIPPSDKKIYRDKFYKDSLSQTDIERFMTSAGVFKPSAIANFVATLKNDMDRPEYEKYDSYYFGDNMIEASVRTEMDNNNVPQVKQTWYFNVHVPQVKKEVYDAIMQAISDHGDKSLPVIDNILYSYYKFKPHVDGTLERLYNGKKKEDFEKVIDALNIDNLKVVKLGIYKAYKLIPYSLIKEYTQHRENNTKTFVDIKHELGDYHKDAIDKFIQHLKPEITKNLDKVSLYYFDRHSRNETESEMTKDKTPKWKIDWFFNDYVKSINKKVKDEMDNAIRTLKGDALIKQVDNILYSNHVQNENDRFEKLKNAKEYLFIEQELKHLESKGFGDHVDEFFTKSLDRLPPSVYSRFESDVDNNRSAFTRIRDEVSTFGLTTNTEQDIVAKLNPVITDPHKLNMIYKSRNLTKDTADQILKDNAYPLRNRTWFVYEKIPEIVAEIKVEINAADKTTFEAVLKKYEIKLNVNTMNLDIEKTENVIDNSLLKQLKFGIFRNFNLGIPPSITQDFNTKITNNELTVEQVQQQMIDTGHYEKTVIDDYITRAKKYFTPVRKFDLRNTK